MKTRDPKGNELKCILLQVMATDERGPTLLQVRRDDERIALADTPEHQRVFFMVWAPENQRGLGEDKLSLLYRNFEELKELSEARESQRVQLCREVDAVMKQVEEMEAADKVKTEELRRLHRERDPARISDQIAVAVADANQATSKELASLRAQLQARDNEIRELKESKRRLKEANERLKKEKSSR